MNPNHFSSYVRKPLFGRKGRNVEIVVNGQHVESTAGPYDGLAIYQQYCPLVRNGRYHAQMGVWMIGTEAAGLGVREDDQMILRSSSRFVPHVIVG
jgi:glutathionylspermidine synthase